MRTIIALWILFTVALLAMLFSCPRSHAQTRIRRQARSGMAFQESEWGPDGNAQETIPAQEF